MFLRAALFCSTLLLAIACALAGCKERGVKPTTAPVKTSAQSPPGLPYEIMWRAYAPYTSPDDPLGFPMKARNLSSNAYRFWRGGKELFYEWCKTGVADWMKDEKAFVRIHGDLHPATLGLYYTRAENGREVAFGPVDFDDAVRLPFQIELLQGVVTVELLARRHKLNLADEQLAPIVDAMMDAYRTTLNSDLAATQLLADDSWVAKLLKEYADTKLDYAVYVKEGKFVPTILDRTGRNRELLRPPKDTAGFAEAVEAALAKSEDAREIFGDAEHFKAKVEDAVWRMQFEVARGEGFRKYLLLVPCKTMPEGKAILYMRQQNPTPAERVGLVGIDPRLPGERSAEFMAAMANPPAFMNGWCIWNNGSYRMGVKEPLGATLDGTPIASSEDLRHLAKIIGTVAGAIHRQGNETVEQIKLRLTPELNGQLMRLGIEAAAKMSSDFRQFVADVRTREQIGKAEAGLKALERRHAESNPRQPQ